MRSTISKQSRRFQIRGRHSIGKELLDVDGASNYFFYIIIYFSKKELTVNG
jgi:hypothetical protein